MAGQAALKQDARRHYAAIVGGFALPSGARFATREYRLGCAWDGDALLVALLDELPDVGIAFEARDFDHAFERAVAISEDVAEVAGHLKDGVVVSLIECDSLEEIGIDAD
jgi:hypothetical protein